MLDGMKFRAHLRFCNAARFRKALLQRRGLSLPLQAIHDRLEFGAVLQGEEHLVAQIRLRIEGDCDVVNVPRGKAFALQAISDGARRKSRPMLAAQEPLFLHCGHHDAVANQRCRCVSVKCVDAKNVHAVWRLRSIWLDAPPRSMEKKDSYCWATA